MKFDLTAPCGNCPFLKAGGVELREGRLEGIIDDLVNDDRNSFYCHNSVYSKHGGEHDEDGNYCASGNEQVCAGSMIYLLKADAPNVALRVAAAFGMVNLRELRRHDALVIDPKR